MWVFIASLTVLFLASIAGYLVVRLRADAWPLPGMPRLPGGLIVATVVLLACSVAVHLALASARRGQTTAMARWLQATFALGALFLVLQAVTWWRLVTLDVTAGSNLYAFTFYMLTGLHGAHVIGGLVQLAFVIAKALRGRYGSGHHPGVLYAAMYWHFLDAVWVVLFLVMFVFA
jgi:heme/copper-type cytochrome/quinol oxidase subunit 3